MMLLSSWRSLEKRPYDEAIALTSLSVTRRRRRLAAVLRPPGADEAISANCAETVLKRLPNDTQRTVMTSTNRKAVSAFHGRHFRNKLPWYHNLRKEADENPVPSALSKLRPRKTLQGHFFALNAAICCMSFAKCRQTVANLEAAVPQSWPNGSGRRWNSVSSTVKDSGGRRALFSRL